MVSSDGTKITKSQKETNPRNMCQEFVFAKNFEEQKVDKRNPVFRMLCQDGAYPGDLFHI